MCMGVVVGGASWALANVLECRACRKGVPACRVGVLAGRVWARLGGEPACVMACRVCWACWVC